ncbi:hypothetical protein CRENBAI_010527 [Crenichthys baileyi]|uniref:Uncharacterized protein n=1 Tax=Crenichthys baileyi TaxID=28760 RepID=A0AAV9SJ27_9TELE
MEEPTHCRQMGSHFQDIQQLLVMKDELPAVKQNWRPSLDQEDLNPPQIKEEEEDTEIMQFKFDPVSVKREDDEGDTQISKLHHNQTEENRLSAGPDEFLESDIEDKTSDSQLH